jgi:hypothetical protein
VVRGLLEAASLVSFALAQGVPVYYFADDNFVAIHDEPERYGRLGEAYTEDALRQALAPLQGVLLATQPLVDFFRERGLGRRLELFPPVVGRRFCEPPEDSALRLAFFAGSHRHDAFQRYVQPALRELARETPCELIAVGLDAQALQEAAGLKLTVLPYEPDYEAALEQLARLRPHVLLHPALPSANNAYKNLNLLINADAVGAVAAASRIPPYTTQPDALQLCGDSVEEWRAGLAELRQPELRRARTRAARAYCDEQLSGRVNAAVLERIYGSHRAPSEAERAERRVAALRLAEEEVARDVRDVDELRQSLHHRLRTIAGHERRLQEQDQRIQETDARLRERESKLRELEAELLGAVGQREVVLADARRLAGDLSAVHESRLLRWSGRLGGADLWDQLAAGYAPLKSWPANAAAHSAGFRLGLGPDLRNGEARYEIALPAGRYTGLLLGFVVYVRAEEGLLQVGVSGAASAEASLDVSRIPPVEPALVPLAFDSSVAGRLQLVVRLQGGRSPLRLLELRRRLGGSAIPFLAPVPAEAGT